MAPGTTTMGPVINAPDAAPNTAPMTTHAATGATAPANNPPIFPNLPFMPIALPPFHIDGPSAFPPSSVGFLDEATVSNLPIGTFDPYYSMNLAPSLADNSTFNMGPSTAAHGSAASTGGLKRSRPTETSEGDREAKRRKGTANRAVTQQEPVYQGFQVARTEAGRSVVTSVHNGVAGEPNHGRRANLINGEIADQFPGTGM